MTVHSGTLSVETIVKYGSPIWEERERKESLLETQWLKTYQTWNEKYIQIHEAQRIPNSLSLQWLQEITLWGNSLWSKTQAIFKATRKKKKVTTCKTSSQHSRETSQQKRCRPGERDDVVKYRKKIKLSRKNIVSRKSTLQKWKRYWKHTKEITKQSWKCSSPENLLYKKCCRNFIRHK